MFNAFNFYCQLDGVAMGSSLGLALTNAFVTLRNSGFLIARKIFVLTSTVRMLMIFIVTFKSHEQLKKCAEYKSAKHLHIKFTFEHNNSFSFLNVKICREDNKLATSVYRKPIVSYLQNFSLRIVFQFKSALSSLFRFKKYHT